MKKKVISRWWNELLIGLLELIARWVFPNTFIFQYFERKFEEDFDKLQRQSCEGSQSSLEKFDWENPLIVSRNRVIGHVPWIGASSIVECHQYWSKPQQIPSSRRFTISKIDNIGSNQNIAWHIRLFNSPSDCPDKWFVKGMKGEEGLPIEPYAWQLQGLDDLPLYTNTIYPFQFNPPFVRRNGNWNITDCDRGINSNCEIRNEINTEMKINSTAVYYCDFEFPSDWCNQQSNNSQKYDFYLIFEGVDSCCTVYLNEQFVGYGQDSCLTQEFCINSQVSLEGKNYLCVQVMRFCDGSYLEDQDKWNLSGIYRDVYIIRKPQFGCIFDYSINPLLIKDQNCGKLNLHVVIQQEDLSSHNPSENEAILPHPIFVRVDIFKPDDERKEYFSICEVREQTTLEKEFATVFDDINVYEAEIDMQGPKNPWKGDLIVEIANPDLWSSEIPSLYVIILSSYSSKEDACTQKNIIDIETCRFGFREVTIDSSHNNALCINGCPLIVAGVNRNEFDPQFGRSMSEKMMEKDIKILKKLFMNSVRCSHYPSCVRWYDLCDETGFYVVDECNIETHGFQVLGQPVNYLSNHAEWRSAMLTRMARMYERDKNHSCIVIWSLGNESGLGHSHHLMYQWLHCRDASRLVQYESGGVQTSATDILCPMYFRPERCLELIRNDSLNNYNRPLILCEYAHAMGNSGGCLEDYWRYFRDQKHHPRFQGGFIWDFVDQALLELSPKAYVDLKKSNVLHKEVEKVDKVDKVEELEELEAIVPSKTRKAKRFRYGGDFQDYPNSRQFCINGIVSADRELLHPSALEAASLQFPLRFELVDTKEMKEDNSISYQDNNKDNDNKKDIPNISDTQEANVARIGRLFLKVRNDRMFTTPEEWKVEVGLGCNLHNNNNENQDIQYVEIPGHTLLPQRCTYYELSTLLPGYKESDYCQLLGINSAQLSQIVDIWLSVRVRQRNGSRYFESNETLVHITLTHNHLAKDLVALNRISSHSISNYSCHNSVHNQRNLDYSCCLSLSELSALTSWLKVEQSYNGIVVRKICRTSTTASSSINGDTHGNNNSDGNTTTNTYTNTDGNLKSVPMKSSDVDSISNGDYKQYNVSSTSSSDNIIESKTTISTSSAQTTSSCECIKDSICAFELQWKLPQNGNESAELSSWKVFQEEILSSAMVLCFYRAPTDNDLGGDWPFPLSWNSRWKAAGLHDLQVDPSSVIQTVCFLDEFDMEITPKNTVCHEGGSTLCIPISSSLKVVIEYRLISLSVSTTILLCRSEYIVRSSGSMELAWNVTCSASLPPFPRVGITWSVDRCIYDQVWWSGWGPQECYGDRKAGVHRGIFQCSMEDMHVPYVKPQENGSRCDPSWILLKNGGSGKCLVPSLLLIPNYTALNLESGRSFHDTEKYSFSYSPYSLTNLMKYLHDDELPRENEGYLHLDSGMMGVGGYDSWSPNVRSEYWVEKCLSSFPSIYDLIGWSKREYNINCKIDCIDSQLTNTDILDQILRRTTIAEGNKK